VRGGGYGGGSGTGENNSKTEDTDCEFHSNWAPDRGKMELQNLVLVAFRAGGDSGAAYRAGHSGRDSLAAWRHMRGRRRNRGGSGTGKNDRKSEDADSKFHFGFGSWWDRWNSNKVLGKSPYQTIEEFPLLRRMVT
jgi:hypothetical protein